MPAFLKPLWAASLALVLGAPLGALANTAQDTPPGYDAGCNCYRNVPYGPVVWFEPTTKKVTRQVMDIYVPQGTPPAAGWPVAYYGHPNGMNHFIRRESTPGSRWAELVQPLLDAGYMVVSYEFRHPVVNYEEGKPAPRYDIQRAINTFTANYAQTLNADPANSFITGNSRGGGLGLLTALTGNFTGGTQIRAVWISQAQTSFDCDEAADTFVLPAERLLFLARCKAVPGAGSALRSVRAGAPPVVATYQNAFRKELVHAYEADLHFPDFGWQLCLRYQAQAQSESNRCQPVDNVAPAAAWSGAVAFFDSHRSQ